MTRTENDLRDALRHLERRADDHGAPSAAELLGRTGSDGSDGSASHRRSGLSRLPRWIGPLAAAAAVAAAAITVTAIGTAHHGSSGRDAAGGPQSTTTAVPDPTPVPAQTPSATATAAPVTSAAQILDDAATQLAAAPFTTPGPAQFFYVRTTDVTTWTSVSGHDPGRGHNSDGLPITILGCRNGHLVSTGRESGDCTLDDVPHYRADAPTDPTDWDAYLERMAPGAKEADAQGKIIVQVLNQDLVAPKAAAALLRYTASCPGLHTLTVAPVAGEKLMGVTCTSMTNGSYGLAFDATSHAFVGFAPVTSAGTQDGPAEIIRTKAIVAAAGDKP